MYFLYNIHHFNTFANQKINPKTFKILFLKFPPVLQHFNSMVPMVPDPFPGAFSRRLSYLIHLIPTQISVVLQLPACTF